MTFWHIKQLLMKGRACRMSAQFAFNILLTIIKYYNCGTWVNDLCWFIVTSFIKEPDDAPKTKVCSAVLFQMWLYNYLLKCICKPCLRDRCMLSDTWADVLTKVLSRCAFRSNSCVALFSVLFLHDHVWDNMNAGVRLWCAGLCCVLWFAPSPFPGLFTSGTFTAEM